jgi:hypothetical protein
VFEIPQFLPQVVKIWHEISDDLITRVAVEEVRR